MEHTSRPDEGHNDNRAEVPHERRKQETLDREFSEGPAAHGVVAGPSTEDEIAEAIFDWWISGKPYKEWYADKYIHQKIPFGE